MKTISQIATNLFLIVGIYIFYLFPLFEIHNTQPSIIDYLTFSLHTFLIYVLLHFVLIVPLNYILKFLSKLIAGIYLSLAETFFIFLALADTKIYISQGLHVYDRIVIKTLQNPHWERELQLGTSTFISIVVLLFIIFCLQLLLWFWLRKQKIYFQNKKALWGVVASIIILLTLPSLWIYKKHLPNSSELSNIYPFYSGIIGVPGQYPLIAKYDYPNVTESLTKKNVILITAESLRGDFYSPEFMPRLQSFAKNNGCLTSKRHYSGGHTTEYGVFTALYGLHGYHFEPFRDQDLPSYGLKTLKNHGYTLIGSAAAQLSSWNNSKFLFQVFDKYKEFTSDVIYEDDVNMIEWVQKQIDQSNQKSLFIFMHSNTTHHNYYFPDNFTIYKPVMEKNYNYLQNKYSTATYREKVFNRYKNSVRYLDTTFTDFLESLEDKLGPNTIIVFTGDHGEEFWEHGLLGHGKSNYVNQRVQVPLVICDLSRKILPEVIFSSHVDIFPTIFDLLLLPPTNQFNGFSMLSETFKDRPYTVVTGPEFPFGRNKMGIIESKYKFWLKKSSKYLHYFYKTKVTDINDHVIMDGSDKATLDKTLKAFATDAYLFLDEIHP